MIDQFKKTFVIGILVILCFLNVMLMIKQFITDEELHNCRDKIQFLREDLQALCEHPDEDGEIISVN